MSYLDRPNDFLIHSNDLHEIRILDRAIRFARAEIVCLVQDDDLIPRDGAWLEAGTPTVQQQSQAGNSGWLHGVRELRS